MQAKQAIEQLRALTIGSKSMIACLISSAQHVKIQDQSLPSLPSRDVARNVLDTQMMYRPMQFAGGGSLDKALQNLKSKLSNG